MSYSCEFFLGFYYVILTLTKNVNIKKMLTLSFPLGMPRTQSTPGMVTTMTATDSVLSSQRVAAEASEEEDLEEVAALQPGGASTECW